MFNRMVNRNTKHRGWFMGFQESMEDVLDFIEEEIKRATSTQSQSKKKESHHHFNEEAKCVRCGITMSEVQSGFCRGKNMLNDYLEAGRDEDCIVISRKEFEDKLLDREREAQIEVLTEIFQTCYQEDSKTLELVEEKLSKLSNK